MLPIEVTQALSTWALAFCGPASSRPMVATLARSSFEHIYASILFEIAVSLRAHRMRVHKSRSDRSKPVERGCEISSDRLSFALTETSGVPFQRQSAHVGHAISARGAGKDLKVQFMDKLRG